MEYYLSNSKEWHWVIGSNVDGPRVCQTEWSQSERENQILHIDTYIEALETRNR